MQWRFRGVDPAVIWRGVAYEGEPPPGPWPGRHEAFLRACAMYAGQRERDLIEIVKAIGSGGKDDAEEKDKPKPMHPARRGGVIMPPGVRD